MLAIINPSYFDLDLDFTYNNLHMNITDTELFQLNQLERICDIKKEEYLAADKDHSASQDSGDTIKERTRLQEALKKRAEHTQALNNLHAYQRNHNLPLTRDSLDEN